MKLHLMNLNFLVVCFLVACEKENKKGEKKLISESIVKPAIYWQNLNPDTVYVISSEKELLIYTYQDAVPEVDIPLNMSCSRRLICSYIN